MFSSVSGIISHLSTTLKNSFSETVNMPDEFMSLGSFCQAYRECRSQHEKSTLVANHTKYLKWQLGSANLSSAQICEILKRCLICRTLGHDVSFAVIHAIQLAQSSEIWHHKRTAYVTCCELMDAQSEMAILMVATLQRDLRGRHVPTICLALSAAANFVSAELIPSVDAIVCERLRHSVSMVRRKAVICLGAFLKRDEELIESKFSYLRVSKIVHSAKIL